MEKIKNKVFVAMSGGVDSSVAAALLKKQGYNVTGVFFKPWAPLAYSHCLWQQDRHDAMRVCARLSIPFKTWDFSKKYEKKVVRYMINSYRLGITPNPDVMCNKEIKFGLFLKKALTEGADYIATGHYARIKREFSIFNFQFSNKSKIKNSKNYKLQTANCKLLKGIDNNKDQSYFLWTLTQQQLKHCLFPIGDHTKPEVRKLAKKFGLPNYDKKDSRGVCFVGQLDMKEFLKNNIKPSCGEIRLLSSAYDRVKKKGFEKSVSGRVIGYHDGVYYYTIGQRHRLNIKDGGGPYYVVRKDIKRNILYVTSVAFNSQLLASSAEIKNVNWIATEPKLPLNSQVKIRYRSEPIPATITRITRTVLVVQGRSLYEVKFKKPARALTPGQSAVFYRGQEVLGGGIIINNR